MSSSTDNKSNKEETDAEKQQRDEKRIETNKTDPQKTEFKGFFDSKEPLEEEGTLNPFTGNKQDKE